MPNIQCREQRLCVNPLVKDVRRNPCGEWSDCERRPRRPRPISAGHGGSLIEVARERGRNARRLPCSANWLCLSLGLTQSSGNDAVQADDDWCEPLAWWI